MEMVLIRGERFWLQRVRKRIFAIAEYLLGGTDCIFGHGRGALGNR
jgi:hypothetical protein